MADISDVSAALVSLIAQTLYPNGTGQQSLAGLPVMIYEGWPTQDTLDKDLRAGKAHVSVFTTPNVRNTTRYMKRWVPVVAPVQTLTLTIAGRTITVGGTVATPQIVMAMVNYLPYVYVVQASDTLTSIATGLAAFIPGATNSGPVITVPASAMLTAARVGAQGTSIMEIRRQERIMMMAVWADTPAHRRAVAEPVDVALANTAFLTLTDQTQARVIFRSDRVDDALQKAKLYRRDLLYSVEYATTISETETQITQTQLNVQAAVAGVPPYTNVATIFE